MAGFRRYVRAPWLAGFVLALAMILAASGGALLALESEAARRAEEAAAYVAEADASMAAGNVAGGGFLYIWVIDNYPQTPAKLDAHAALVDLKSQVRSGEVDFARFEAFVRVLPEFWSLNTLEAMNAVANMEHVYAGELLKAGQAEEARQIWAAVVENAIEALRVHWYEPATYSTARIAVYISKKLGTSEQEAVIAELEQYVELAGPCMGSYGVRAALIEYYWQIGNRPARWPHIQPLIDAWTAGYVQDALESPYVDSVQKAGMRNTNGYALMVAGHRNADYLPAALDAYRELDADPTAEGTDFKEWAGFNIARVIHRMHRGDPQAGIAAFEDYLQQRRPPAPGETEWRERPYTNLARVELAKIYLGLGELDKAAEYADQALLEEKYPEIIAMAQDCLRRAFEARSAPQPAQ